MKRLLIKLIIFILVYMSMLTVVTLCWVGAECMIEAWSIPAGWTVGWPVFWPTCSHLKSTVLTKKWGVKKMLKYNTCAHARPGLRPFVPLDCKDHDPVFPVSPCCTRSVQYKVAEPRSYISALPYRDRCESCPMFTDPDTLVHIQADTFRADIYLDRLCDMTIPNTRKLFKLMHRWDFDNRQAIDRLTAHLEQAIQESEDAWKLAPRSLQTAGAR